MTLEEKKLIRFAHRHKVQFLEKAECGLERACVSLTKEGNHIEWTNPTKPEMYMMLLLMNKLECRAFIFKDREKGCKKLLEKKGIKINE